MLNEDIFSIIWEKDILWTLQDRVSGIFCVGISTILKRRAEEGSPGEGLEIDSWANNRIFPSRMVEVKKGSPASEGEPAFTSYLGNPEGRTVSRTNLVNIN